MTARDYDISPWRFPVFAYGLEMATVPGCPATLANYKLEFNYLPKGELNTLPNIVACPTWKIDGIAAWMPEVDFKQFDADQGRMRSLFKCTVDDAPIACWVHYSPEVTRYRAPAPRS